MRFAVLCAITTLPVSALAAPSWSQMKTATWEVSSTASHKDAGKIDITKATVAGVECFGGEANTDVAPEKLLEVVADIEGAVKWSTAGLSQAETLARISATEIDYFEYLDVPGWTMSSDRFWFLKGHIERGSDFTLLHWERLIDGGPYKARWDAIKAENPSAIEPPTNVGAWWFTKAGDQTKIKYYICTDTGGSIPAFVQSAATKQTLPDTIGDVVREAKKRGG